MTFFFFLAIPSALKTQWELSCFQEPKAENESSVFQLGNRDAIWSIQIVENCSRINGNGACCDMGEPQTLRYVKEARHRTLHVV